MKDSTLLIIIAVAAVGGYLLYRRGQTAGVYSDKYTEYANAIQGLANNATGNFLSVHNGISQGINNQINQSVETAINSITNWAQQAADNRNRKDQREHEQFLQTLSTI